MAKKPITGALVALMRVMRAAWLLAFPFPAATRRALAEFLCNHKSNNMRALTLSAAHPQTSSLPQTSPLPGAKKGTFSRCAKGTFPCCGNKLSGGTCKKMRTLVYNAWNEGSA